MKKRLIALLLSLSTLALLAGCGGGSKQAEITLYDGDYSEVQIMHSMIKQLVEAHTDATVTIKDQMSQVNMFKDFSSDNHTCDLMFSYDSSLLNTFLKIDNSEIPADSNLFDYANKMGLEKEGVYLLEKVGLNNAYTIGVTQKVVDTYGVSKISDLIPIASELLIGAEHEFCHDEGTIKYNPFVQFYGLEFKDLIQVDVQLKYSGVIQGSYDVMVVYATDGMNKEAGLTILEDDWGFFPEFNGAILVRDELFETFKDAAPNLKDVLSMLSGNITTEDMINLTYEVDVQGKSVSETAAAFLTEKGLV